MLKENSEKSRESYNFLVSRLTDLETSLEERISAANQLFPDERRLEMMATADKDVRGRPVRYFRLMTYQELKVLLNSDEINRFQNPVASEFFFQNAKEIRKDLDYYLEERGLDKDLAADLAELDKDFTPENLKIFLQTKIPRLSLYWFHIRGRHNSYMFTGLNSLSVGAPYQTPYDPYRGSDVEGRHRRHKEGIPVVEFCVPADEITVFPTQLNDGMREMEKEVTARTLKPEWITAVYNGKDDFIERFVRDPQSVLYPEYMAAKDSDSIIKHYISNGQAFDMLQKWKQSESTADLIPASKVDDLDDNNPDLKKPFA